MKAYYAAHPEARKSPMEGRRHSAESRAKMSAAKRSRRETV